MHSRIPISNLAKYAKKKIAFVSNFEFWIGDGGDDVAVTGGGLMPMGTSAFGEMEDG